MNQNFVLLKEGKDKPILNRHHWIFSGAIARYPEEMQNGQILPVKNAGGNHLGYAYFNRTSSIAGRMVCFDGTNPLQAIRAHLESAIALRRRLFNPEITNAYRLVNSEGDLLPGLVVDYYAGIIVIQISTLGMECLREWLVQQLIDLVKPKGIYEKSNLPSRKLEGLQPRQSILYGEVPESVEIIENGLHFTVAIAEGQKTGFFLDQRENRQQIRSLSHSKRVLNIFSYTGGFSIYAKAGGASQVCSIDISEKALSLLEQNFLLNQFSTHSTQNIAADAFEYLRQQELDFDLVILDPPAFAKRKQDVVQACRGYKDLNRLAMKKMPKNSLLLTCSCSHYVDKGLFQQILFQAAAEAGRNLKIIGTHLMAADHPINIFHPENDYLKSYLLYLE